MVCGLERVGTRAEKTVGWNVKPSLSHVELPVCSGVRCQEVCRQDVISA